MERDLIDRLNTDRKYLRAAKRFNMATNPEDQVRKYTAKCKRFYEIMDRELTNQTGSGKRMEGQ